MRVLVTGATGFIGAHLCAELVQAGHRVAVLVRSPDHWRLKPFLGQVAVIRGDLSDLPAWQAELDLFSPNAVAHLAWNGVAGGSRNDPTQVDNIRWTTSLVSAAVKSGAEVFLGAGSQAEYGLKQTIISAGDAESPTTIYGEAKLAACRLSEKVATIEGIRFVWPRVFSTYGAGDYPGWMIPSLIGKLLQGGRPPLTKGEQLWDFLHVSDAASAMRRLIESDRAHGVYNLGSGTAPRLRSTIELIRDEIDPGLELGWGEVPYRPDQVMLLQADTAPLNALGWAPQMSLDQGISDCVDWYKKNLWIYSTV